MANNTGYKGYNKLLKVTDDGTNRALDVNGDLCSESGLPQYWKANDVSDTDYVPPVYDSNACPIPPPSYYTYNFSNPGVSTAIIACAKTEFPTSMYASVSSLSMGTVLHGNTSLTSPVNGANLWYLLGANDTAYRINGSGVITEITSCAGLANILMLAYNGTNSVRSVATASWSSARTEGDLPQSTNFTVGAYLNGLYLVHRAFFGFDTAGVTGATSAGIRINIATNNLLGATNFVIVKTTGTHPAEQPWGTGHFPESNGAVIHSNIVSVGPGATGELTIPFNSTGLAYINGNDDATFMLVQYTNDYLDSAPSSSANQIIQGANNDVYMYYS